MDIAQIGNKDELGVIGKLKDGLYGALVLLKGTVYTERYLMFSTGMICLQLIYFPLSVTPVLKSSGVMDLFRGLVWAPKEWSVTGEMTVTAIYAAILGMACFLFAGLASDEVYQTKNFVAMTPLIAWVLRILQTIAQVPITFFLAELAVGNLNVSESFPVVGNVIGCILLILHFLLISVFAVATLQELPFDQGGKVVRLTNQVAAPHGRVELFATAVRGIAVVTFVFLQNTLVSVQLIVMLLLMLFVSFAYGYYQPFFRTLQNQYCCALYAVVAWIITAAVAGNLTGDAGDHSGVLLMTIPLPCVLISAISLVSQHLHRIRNHPGNATLGVYLAELRLRLLYLSEKNKLVELQDEMLAEYRNFLEQYPSTRSAFPCLFVASLATRAGNRVIFALNLLTQVRKNQLPFDLDFYLFYHNKRNSKNQDGNDNAISFIAIDQHLDQAKHSLIQTLKNTANFWRKVSHGSCTLNELLLQGSKVHEEAMQCRFHLGKLRKLSHTNKQAMRLQSLFYFYVMNDRETASQIEQEIIKNVNNNNGDTGYAVCTISGDPSTIGRVLDASAALCELFGYARSDLIGHNVCILCPPPFDVVHDMFLKQFVGIDSEFVTQTRRIWGLHAKGHIILVDFEVTPSTNAHSELILIGRFVKVQQNESTHLILCDSKNQNVITAFSQQAPSVLGLDESDVFAMNMKITDILPDFQTTDHYEKERTVGINDKTFSVKSKFVRFKNKPESPVVFDVSAYVITLVMQQHNIHFMSSIEGLAAPDSPNLGHQPPLLDVQAEGNDDSFRKNDGERKALLSPTVNRLERSNSGKSGKSGKSWGTRRYNQQRGFDQQSFGSNGTGITAKDLHISQIQRKILQKLQSKDKAMVYFAHFTKRFVWGFILFIILQIIVDHYLFARYVDEAIMIQQAQISAHEMAITSLGVLYKDMDNESFVPSAFLRQSIDEMKNIHGGVVGAYSDDATSSISWVDINEPNIMIIDDPAEPSKYHRNISYHVSVLEFISNTENYLLEDALECLRSCEFILANGMEVIETTVMIAQSFLEFSLEKVTQIQVYDLIAYTVVGSICLLSFLYGFLPVFFKFNQKRLKVGKSFLVIPPEISKSLQSRTEKRLAQLASSQTLEVMIAADAEQDDVMEEAEDEFASGKFSPLTSSMTGSITMKRSSSSSQKGMSMAAGGQLAQQNSKAKMASSKQVEVLGGASQFTSKPNGNKVRPVETVNGVKQVGNRKLKRDACSKMIFAFLKQLIEASLPFWVIVAFCLIQIFIFSMNDADTLEGMTAAVSVAGDRFVAFDRIHFFLMANDTSILTAEERIDVLNKLMGDVRLADNVLKYGDPSRKIRPMEDTEGELYKLYFEDACDTECVMFMKSANSTLSNPETVQHVLNLNHGLVLAMERYLLLVDEILELEAACVATNYNDATKIAALLKLKSQFQYFKPHEILSKQLEVALDKYVTVLVDQVGELKKQKIIAGILALMLLVFARILSINRLNRMDRDLKKNQTLLLMLPYEVFQTVPEISHLLRESQ